MQDQYFLHLQKRPSIDHFLLLLASTFSARTLVFDLSEHGAQYFTKFGLIRKSLAPNSACSFVMYEQTSANA